MLNVKHPTIWTFTSRGRFSLLNYALWFSLLLLSQSANATEYDVEMVIFLNTASHSTELQSANTEIQSRNERELNRLNEKTGSIVGIPVTIGQLSEVVEKLNNDPDYVVVQHTTWRQDVVSISKSPYVDVSALNIGEESGLRGLVRFYQSPLLYVDVFLKYTPFIDPLDQQSNTGPEDSAGSEINPALFLLEKRRVRLKEFHYLDHPQIGAIITVWPIDVEE
ncbi:MAG: hypothetical protein ACI8P9_004638 [Parasphingorhabdus sp.]|jgi:hypothetical protein